MLKGICRGCPANEWIFPPEKIDNPASQALIMFQNNLQGMPFGVKAASGPEVLGLTLAPC